MQERNYQVQTKHGLNPMVIQAQRPQQAAAIWLSRLSRMPVQEQDMRGKFRVEPDDFHVIVE